MADDNKNIPPSAGEAAKEIMEDDKDVAENKVETVDRKTYEDSKKLASAVDYGNKSGAGWKVATLLLAIVAIGACGACVYMSLNESNGGSSNDSNRTKCDVKVADGVDNVEKGDTGDIATSTSSDVVLKFKKSGINLNMGSKFTVLNSAYSQDPVGNPYEQIVLGGLSENTTGAQNIPDFATGNLPTYDFNEASETGYWMVMATLSVYEKSWWDAMGVDNDIAEAEANGVAPAYNIVYRDDNYIISYNHPQNVVSDEGWARDWEVATHDAFEAIFKDSANWSK